jgi:galactokinase
VAAHPLGRHVVTENQRVLEFARLLERGDVGALGGVLGASHASLRDDFGVSTPELDVLVSELVAAGALGARLTGAGFGGCVVAACATRGAENVIEAALARYRVLTALEPTAFVCRAAGGAGAISTPRSSGSVTLAP